jgi:RHS repeat-associated protein
MVKNVDTTPTVTYYHPDLIGTTRFMTDASGNKIEGGVYTAFGELASGSPRRYGYAGAWGYQTDDAGDMPFIHVGHRYYDPTTGRFLQRDPIGIAGALNVYVYAGLAPPVRVDPTGLYDEPNDAPVGPSASDAHGNPRPPKPKPPRTPEEELDDIGQNERNWNYVYGGLACIAAPVSWPIAVGLGVGIIVREAILDNAT